MRREHQIRGLRKAYSKPPTVRGDLCLATAHGCLKGERGPMILYLQVFQESVLESVCVCVSVCEGQGVVGVVVGALSVKNSYMCSPVQRKYIFAYTYPPKPPL